MIGLATDLAHALRMALGGSLLAMLVAAVVIGGVLWTLGWVRRRGAGRHSPAPADASERWDRREAA